jgi:hypothetical protein
MALVERTSEHLGIPYVYLKEQKKFLCQNGVLFTLDEYKNGIDLNAEYERRLKEDMLYDYNYAKSTGLLRKKRGYKKTEEVSEGNENDTEWHNDAGNTGNHDLSQNDASKDFSGSTESNGYQTIENRSNQGSDTNGWNSSVIDGQREKQGFSIYFVIALLAFTSVISMYISTLHTATYLYDYASLITAWLMSASVTAYNTTAFEVSVLFHTSKRNFMAVIFMFLWVLVTLFSMATEVSVFYDRFNFQEVQIAQENKDIDSGKLALELLRTKEKDLREAIEFKKHDIEYRQEHDYATTAVRKELNDLQENLQKNLSEQEELLKATPEVTQEVIKRRESLFAFLGRLLHLDGGVLEFIMSTLSAIFVNLIAPLSLSAVIELTKKEEK